MNINSLVLFAHFLFTFGSDLLLEINSGPWFFNYLVRTKDKKMAADFDFITSLNFFYNGNDLNTFSPICLDFNILIQRANSQFDDRNEKLAIEELESVFSPLENIHNNVFSISHQFVTPPKFQGRYRLDNNVDEEGNIEETSAESLSKKWKVGDLSQIIVTTAVIKGELLNKFEERLFTNEQVKGPFSCSNSTRTFMNATGEFKFGEPLAEDCKYNIVALPYKETNSNRFTRYLVYIIPKSRISLSMLWSYFYDFSKGNIKNTIINLENTKINLSVPLKEEFEEYPLISFQQFRGINMYKNIQSSNPFKIIALFNSIESTLEESCREKIILNSFIPECNIPHVRGDESFISFVYDMDLERILFIRKHKKE